VKKDEHDLEDRPFLRYRAKNGELPQLNLQVNADWKYVLRQTGSVMPPARKKHSSKVVVELTGYADREIIPCPTLQREIVVGLGADERHEQLLVILPYRDVDTELISISHCISIGIPDPILDSATVLECKPPELVCVSEVEAEPVLELSAEAAGLRGDVEIRGSEREILIQRNLKPEPDPFVHRRSSILAEPEVSEHKQRQAVDTFPVLILRTDDRKNKVRFVPDLEVGLRRLGPGCGTHTQNRKSYECR
jgi:hypothetical protein